MKNIHALIIVTFLLFSGFRADAQLYKNLYAEVNLIGGSTFFEVLGLGGKDVIIPKSAEIGYHLTDEFNVNLGYHPDRYRKNTTPLLPLFESERETIQKGNIYYVGCEYFGLQLKSISINAGFKALYGTYSNQEVVIDPDFTGSYLKTEKGSKRGLEFDFVMLIHLNKYFSISINPIAARFERDNAMVSVIDNTVNAEYAVSAVNLQLYYLSQIGIRFNL